MPATETPPSLVSPPSPTGAPPSSSRAVIGTVATVVCIGAAAAVFAALRHGGRLLDALAALLLWAATASTLQFLGSPSRASAGSRSSRWPTFARHGLLFAGAIAASVFVWHASRHSAVLAFADDGLRLFALLLGGGAVLAWFLAALAQAQDAHNGIVSVAPLRPLLVLLAIVCFSAALLAFLRLATGTDWLPRHTFVTGALTALLVLEALAGFVVRLYQPRALRERSEAFGRSGILHACFRRDNPWQVVARSLEQTFGLKVGETALFPFLQRTLEPAMLAGVFLLWLSTGVTMIPADSDGVLVRAGHFATTPLPPGLHIHRPWPFARVEIVPSRRVQTLTLGFDQDLDGPILWAEQHYAGEKSLLVGRGDELLTVSVPLHYRIADPVAYLSHCSDIALALRALGYRELHTQTATHSSFGLMTTDRSAVAEALRVRLQAACDTHRLGVEIVWVGLKDIHPPVPVAPAFQDVISAEEERRTLVDRERALSVTSLQEARSTAQRLRADANAFAHERTALATGEAARFAANADASRTLREVFQARRTFDSADIGLRTARSLLVVPPAAARNEYLLDVKSPIPLLPTLAQ